ncbi:MAG TPA: COX15/CtaA family protein, partial [Quisquiliibacterium sp.]|nr:COX15/CtaA family protein [Quisquiliibacterium sp.]
AFGWIAAGGARTAPGEARAGGLTVLAWSALALAGLQSALGVMIGARRAVGACAQALCVPQSSVDPAVFDPRVVMAVAGAADGQALHLVHRLVAVSIAACVVWMIVRSRSGRRVPASRRQRALLSWAAASVVLLAPLGLATASGFSGVASGTLHNVLAGAVCVFLAALARIWSAGDGIDSH